MQINENPQPTMSMKRIMRWGHDFPKDKGGGNVNLEPVWGKAMCHGENPSELSTTLFLVFSSQPFILPGSG